MPRQGVPELAAAPEEEATGRRKISNNLAQEVPQAGRRPRGRSLGTERGKKAAVELAEDLVPIENEDAACRKRVGQAIGRANEIQDNADPRVGSWCRLRPLAGRRR